MSKSRVTGVLKFESERKGTRYRAQVYAGLRSDGTKRMLFKTFDTAQEAKAWRSEQEQKKSKRTLVVGRCTVGELLDDLQADYKNARSTWGLLVIEKHLRPALGTLRADEINTTEINRYIAARRTKGVSDPTIGGELAVLRRAYRFSLYKQDPPKVDRVPRFPSLKKSDPRLGFFEDSEYRALLGELPEEIRPLFAYLYWSGSRKGEALALLWSEVDLEARIVRLPGSKTKSGHPRTIPIAPDALEALKIQRALRDQFWPCCKWVFFRHASGERLKSIGTAWRLACKRAGLWDATAGKMDGDGKPVGKPTRIIHDLRRTTVRNLVRSGVSERVAQKISGHLTRTVFDRYDISSDRDLQDATQRLDQHIQGKRNLNGIQNDPGSDKESSKNPSNLLN